MTQRPHIDRSCSRRELLSAAVAGTALAATAGIVRAQPATPSGSIGNTPATKRVLRFAHPTDTHVWPQLRGGEGMHAAFTHMMSLKDPPALIVTGGDLPMDTGSTSEAESKVQWDLFKQVLKDTVPASVPIHHTLGNHDIFGRDKKKSGATGQEKLFGRRWFLDNFSYERTYRSFDHSGWHFIILDSIHMLGTDGDYEARIGGEQLDWLKQDLARTPKTTPIVVSSHIPILSVVNYFEGDDGEWIKQSPDLKISTKRMHVDCRELDKLFRAHGNVKLCLSGHIHLAGKAEYNGITYITDGAVSGDKWKGPRRESAEGYGLIDLYADGSFRHEYVTYGWNANKKS